MLLSVIDGNIKDSVTYLKFVTEQLRHCRSLIISSQYTLKGSEGKFVDKHKKMIYKLIANKCFSPVKDFQQHINNTIVSYINEFEDDLKKPIYSFNFAKLYSSESLIHIFFHTSKVSDITFKDSLLKLYNDPNLNRAMEIHQFDYEETYKVKTFSKRQEILSYLILLHKLNENELNPLKCLVKCIAMYVFLSDEDLIPMNYELIRSILRNKFPLEEDVLLLYNKYVDEIYLTSEDFVHFIIHSTDPW